MTQRENSICDTAPPTLLAPHKRHAHTAVVGARRLNSSTDKNTLRRLEARDAAEFLSVWAIPRLASIMMCSRDQRGHCSPSETGPLFMRPSWIPRQ